MHRTLTETISHLRPRWFPRASAAASLLLIATLVLSQAGCATSDRDKALQYRATLSAARQGYIAGRHAGLIDARTYLRIYEADKRARAALDDIEAMIAAGLPIEHAAWLGIAKQIAQIRADTDAAKRPPS